MIVRLLAHTGGFSWDEALFLLVPVIVLVVLARQARKKAAELEEPSDDPPRADG